MPPRLILVGRVSGAFGVRGELKINAFTTAPEALGDYGPLLNADGQPVLNLTAVRASKSVAIARAREVDSREQAEALRGLQLYITRSSLPPPDDDDEFYLADLVSLEARDPTGEPIGMVKSAQDFGAGDLLEIAPADGGPTWWLPFTLEAVPSVNIAEGWLTAVRPVETE
jgi:16S rRNA processing protein RimM